MTPHQFRHFAGELILRDNPGAYALVQGSEPQVAALGLNDSPVGLAGWIVEKFLRWSDCEGDVERCFTKDELLTNVTLYWHFMIITAAVTVAVIAGFPLVA